MMSKRLFKTTAVLTLLTAVQPFMAQAEKMGPGGTGGGDEFVADFVALAKADVLQMIVSSNVLPTDEQKTQYLTAVDPKKISSVDEVYESCNGSKDGRQVSICYNKGFDHFFISRTRYPLKNNSDAKMRLIAHEVFRRMNLEGDNYELSQRLVAREVISLATTENTMNVPSQKLPADIALMLKTSLNYSTQKSVAAYDQLADAMRQSAMDQFNLATQTQAAVQQMISEWIKSKQQSASGYSGDGVIRVNLNRSEESAETGYSYMPGDASWMAYSQRYRSYRSEHNADSYNQALVTALSAALNAQGFAVLSVGTIDSKSESATRDGSGISNYNRTTQSFAFIGPKANAQVEIAGRTFQQMTMAEGLSAMGRIYSLALQQLEADLREELSQRGYTENTASYFTELTKLMARANLGMSVTLFKDKASAEKFVQSLAPNLTSEPGSKILETK